MSRTQGGVRGPVRLRRICHIHLLPLMSGPQHSTLRLFEHLDADRYELHVVLSAEGEFTHELRRRGVRIHVLPTLVREISPIRDLRAVTALIRLLRRERFDLVHTHSSKPGIIGRIAAWVAGVPAVHHVRGFAFHEFSSRWEWALYATLEAFAARICDRVIFVNDEERLWAAAHRVVPASMGCTVYNGVDLSVFNPQTRRQLRPEARDQLELRAGRPVISFVGRLDRQKDPLQLVAMLSELRARFPELDPLLIVAGDGELRQPLLKAALEAGQDERLRILGWRDDVPALLAASDVLYLPSLFEGLPRVLIEAACMGLPAVANDVKGNREVIIDGETGRLVPVGDLAAAAMAIGDLLTEPERARRLGEAAAERGRALYDARETARAIERVYDEILR